MPPERASRGVLVALCSVLAGLTVAVYWPVRHFEFLDFDDPAYVIANPQVFGGLKLQSLRWAFTTFHAANWHPLTWISHMLDCEIFSDDDGRHHLVNLAIHTANTLLLFLLLNRWTQAIWRSALVAALFAWHPLHVESVAWIAERKDVLSTFFGLLALGAYVRYAGDAGRGPTRSRKFWYAGTLVSLLLGLMSKPMLVTWPFLFFLLDFWPLGRAKVPAWLVLGSRTEDDSEPPKVRWRQLVLEKLPFLVMSVAASAVTLHAQRAGEAVVAVAALPLPSRLANAVVAYATYLRRVFWPVDLAAFYPYRHAIPPLHVLIALGCLGLVTVLTLALARRRPYLLLGWLWFLGMLVPVIGVVQVGGQSMADRYTYFSLTGIFIAFVWTGFDLLATRPKLARIGTVVAAMALAACLGLTRVQAGYWRTSETLFTRDLELYPQNNATAHHCLGRALYERGDDAGAMRHYEILLTLLPEFGPGHLNLANCLARQRRYPEAQAHYETAIRLKPDNAEIFKSFGAMLAAELKFEAARTNYLNALRLKPDYAEAHRRLGTLLMAMGEPGPALEHLTDAVRIQPGDEEAQYYLGAALAEKKQYADAARHFQAALKVNPENPEAMNGLARIWATDNQFSATQLSEAIRLAGRACELTRFQNPACLETLGIALSETGRLPEALKAAEMAFQLAKQAGDLDQANALQRQGALYRNGRSYSGRTASSNAP